MSIVSNVGFILAIGQGSLAFIAVFFLSLSIYAAAWPKILLNALRHGVIWLLPLLALVSTIWSHMPATSARTAIELILTTLFSLVLAQAQPVHRVIGAFMCALLLAIVAGVFLGGSETIYYTGQTALNGLFSSKNNFAAFNALLLISAVSVYAARTSRRPMRLLALGGILISAFFLIMARSVGALAAVAVSTGVSLLVILMSGLPQRLRGSVMAGLLGLGLLLAGFLLVLLISDGSLLESVLNAVGKNSGLTGRSYLWIRAAELIDKNPLFGLGYQSFWAKEYVEAEGMWRYMRITSRSGVTFHNLFYETAVELGWLGVLAMAAGIGATLGKACQLAWRQPGAESAWLLGILVFLLTRIYLEVDFLFPFNIGQVLLPIVYTMASRLLPPAPSGRLMHPRPAIPRAIPWTIPWAGADPAGTPRAAGLR